MCGDGEGEGAIEAESCGRGEGVYGALQRSIGSISRYLTTGYL
jgi:hypothetical protein